MELLCVTALQEVLCSAIRKTITKKETVENYATTK